MRVFDVADRQWRELAHEEALELAWRSMRSGQVIGIPTDTVVGLAADPSNPDAIVRIFELKDRPFNVAVPVLVSDLEQALTQVEIREDQIPTLSRLANDYWPGPLTIVVACRRLEGWGVGGDGVTIGLRSPYQSFAAELCSQSPIAATSGNAHGYEPANQGADLLKALFRGGEVDYGSLLHKGLRHVFDGTAKGGLSSTVVDISVSPWVLRRTGPISRQDLEQTIGESSLTN